MKSLSLSHGDLRVCDNLIPFHPQSVNSARIIGRARALGGMAKIVEISTRGRWNDRNRWAGIWWANIHYHFQKNLKTEIKFTNHPLIVFLYVLHVSMV